MEQINAYNQHDGFWSRFKTLRHNVAVAIKWWAEHQAWPATDEIRIDRHRSTCG